ncbi:uncharacterized protein LOC135211376 [Macrobrachium nipponense]|uniref:uncharacterized protein LOC135211376 n=1 Tax=Macrobrachium nipponense TaxID=159736 RepID=UPI0030C82DA4
MPRAPWKGGFFESLVGVAKCTLKVSFQKKSFPEEHVRILVKEAEGMVNNRPNMYTGDGREYQVLTPSHLLPPEDLNQTLTTRKLRDHYLKLMDTHACWRREYLSALHSRHDSRPRKRTDLLPGDVMLIKIEQCKRAACPPPTLVRLQRSIPMTMGSSDLPRCCMTA